MTIKLTQEQDLRAGARDVLVNNARDMLEQVDKASVRIADGSYGVCENCGKPIGKPDFRPSPATLCRTCKEAEERF